MTARQNVGYHSARAALHARLARTHPQLATADATDDFAVALLDGWAVVAEILGFHAARTHEETSLDLAVELRSVAELARLVGYRPDPGVAATVALAFGADPALGPGASVTVPLGIAVSSTPVPGAEPVMFETVEEIEARPAWNALRPRLAHRQESDPDRLPPVLQLAGTSTNLLPGDGILVPGPGGNSSRFGVVASVTVRPDELPTAFTPGRPGWTEVRLVPVGAGVSAAGRLPQPEPPPDPAPGPLVGSVLVADPGAPGVPAAELQERARAEGFAEAELFDALRAARPSPRHVVVFRAQTGIFASTAPEWRALPGRCAWTSSRPSATSSPRPRSATRSCRTSSTTSPTARSTSSPGPTARSGWRGRVTPWGATPARTRGRARATSSATSWSAVWAPARWCSATAARGRCSSPRRSQR